jgi:gamma-aminobutyric acid type B receptor
LYWIIAVYAFILITQFISVFLAFKTRKVKIKALNDARYITVIIYVTTIIVVVMIVCAVLLSDQLNADGAVFAGLFYIFTTIVLSVLFIPKVLQILALLSMEHTVMINILCRW